MITDLQGWKISGGQYIVTDPIVFSNISDSSLGLIDWGYNGMTNFLNNHICND